MQSGDTISGDSTGEPSTASGGLQRTKSPRWSQKGKARCLADGCGVELDKNSAYNLRYRLCEDHIKALTLHQNGVAKRFCQQCSRLHDVTEFDGKRRSCIKRLQLHKQRQRAKLAKKQMELEGTASPSGGGFLPGLAPLPSFPAEKAPPAKVSFAEELQQIRTFVSDPQPTSYDDARPYSAGNSPRASLYPSPSQRPFSAGASPRQSYASSAYSSDNNSDGSGYVEPPLHDFSLPSGPFDLPMNSQNSLNMEMRRIIVEIRGDGGDGTGDMRRLDVPQIRPQHCVPARSKTAGNLGGFLGGNAGNASSSMLQHAEPLAPVGTLSGRARTWGGGQEELRRMSEEVALETTAAAASAARLELQQELSTGNLPAVSRSMAPMAPLSLGSGAFGGMASRPSGGGVLSSNFGDFRISSPAPSPPSASVSPCQPSPSGGFPAGGGVAGRPAPMPTMHPQVPSSGMGVNGMAQFGPFPEPTPDLLDILPNILDPDF